MPANTIRTDVPRLRYGSSHAPAQSPLSALLSKQGMQPITSPRVGSSVPGVTPRSALQTSGLAAAPGTSTDPKAALAQALMGGRLDPGSLIGLLKPLEAKPAQPARQPAARTTPQTQRQTTPQTLGTTHGAHFGKVVLSAGADRQGVKTSKAVIAFVSKIAGIAKTRLTIGTGTNHSHMTVDGNVSDHWSGHAADIPATGKELIRLGQIALVAAGADPKWALKQKGGLYNINGHQVIFNTHKGGDHTNHLHVSAR